MKRGLIKKGLSILKGRLGPVVKFLRKGSVASRRWLVKNRGVILAASAGAATSSLVSYAINSILDDDATAAGVPADIEKTGISFETNPWPQISSYRSRISSEIRSTVLSLSTALNQMDHDEAQKASIKLQLLISKLYQTIEDSETFSVSVEAQRLSTALTATGNFPTSEDRVQDIIVSDLAHESLNIDSELTQTVRFVNMGIYLEK